MMIYWGVLVSPSCWRCQTLCHLIGMPGTPQPRSDRTRSLPSHGWPWPSPRGTE